MNKLIYNFPINIFFIDWDDTIFNTSELNINSFKFNKNLLNLKEFSNFKILDDYVFDFLIFLLKKGDIYIISNASKSWILTSCKIYMPKVFSIFHYLKIHSSFDEWSILNNGKFFDGTDCKFNTMKNILKIYKNINIRILNIGDSDYEKNAAINILNLNYKNIKNISIIKLKDNPNLQIIISQLIFLKNNYINILSNNSIIYL